jgi:hypothetical protein
LTVILVSAVLRETSAMRGNTGVGVVIKQR